MRRTKLITAIAVIAVIASVPSLQPAFAQDEIFSYPGASQEPEKKPNPPPVSAVDIRGDWATDSAGKTLCGKGMTITFSSNTAGTSINGKYLSQIRATLSGRTLSFVSKYTDFFGNPATENWVGTISDDGRTIIGMVHGGWGDGCSFVMSKR